MGKSNHRFVFSFHLSSLIDANRLIVLALFFAIEIHNHIRVENASLYLFLCLHFMNCQVASLHNQTFITIETSYFSKISSIYSKFLFCEYNKNYFTTKIMENENENGENSGPTSAKLKCMAPINSMRNRYLNTETADVWFAFVTEKVRIPAHKYICVN